MSETGEVNNAVGYPKRIVAFIDMLGFRDLVSISTLHPEAVQHLYTLLKGIQSHQVMEMIYGGIPCLGIGGDWAAKPAAAIQNPESRAQVYNAALEAWPLEITQFSDSLVLSCPADNGQSCVLLLEFVSQLILACFQLGILLRGGITIGQLIHEEGGPLFGPAFVEAYALESKQAKWPRILVDQVVVDLARATEQALPNSKPFDLLFNSVTVFDAESQLNDKTQMADKQQLTLATAYRFLSKYGKFNFEPEAVSNKLLSLAQSYATDEKLGPRYFALLQDWQTIYQLK